MCLRQVNLDHEEFAGLQEPNQRLNSTLHQWVTSAKYFLRTCFICYFLTCGSTFAQAAFFLSRIETPWAVEAFIMVAAVLEKDKVADHKIFHSLLAVEGSCGLLE